MNEEIAKLGFNPLKIGSYCNERSWVKAYLRFRSFNPLKIGSYCNRRSRKKLGKSLPSFNPLKIGSYCNIHITKELFDYINYLGVETKVIEDADGYIVNVKLI